jgi:hypothetical protein
VPRLPRATTLVGGLRLPRLRGRARLADRRRVLSLRRLRSTHLGDGGDDLCWHALAADALVCGRLVHHQPEESARSACSARSAWARARRPGLGCTSSGGRWCDRAATGCRARSRSTRATWVALLRARLAAGQRRRRSVAVAVEKRGRGMGRIRLARIPDPSADSLLPVIKEVVRARKRRLDRRSSRLQAARCRRLHPRPAKHPGERRSRARRDAPRPPRLLPAQRWLLGTHQGAVRPQQLDYYLDEFTFRFNRRSSNHRGLLFYRSSSKRPRPSRSRWPGCSAAPHSPSSGGSCNEGHRSG